MYADLTGGGVTVTGSSLPVITPPATAFVAGDIIRYVRASNVLSMYKNGVFINSGTVPTALTSTNVGIYLYQDVTSSVAKFEVY